MLRVGLIQALALMESLSLAVVLATLLVGGSDPARSPPAPISSGPVQVPADFCLGYADEDKTCAARVSFPVLPDGTVGKIEFVDSSRNYDCDRAVLRSVRSRRYPATRGFFLRNEAVKSQTCRSLFER